MNGEAFRVYVDEVLAPSLSDGDIVVIDNLPAHKVEGVRTAIEARGAILVYSALGVTDRFEKAKWAVLSFRRADPADPDLSALRPPRAVSSIPNTRTASRWSGMTIRVRRGSSLAAWAGTSGRADCRPGSRMHGVSLTMRCCGSA